MATQKDSWRQIATYLLFVFGLSSVFYLLVLKAHTLAAAGGLSVLGIHVVSRVGGNGDA
jgi:cytochrome c biogenesis protein CcdA